MKDLLRINDLNAEDIYKIFSIADQIEMYRNSCIGKNFVLFFPESSIRTRITFEIAIKFLGGNIIRFPSTALDKDEPIEDVIGYMNNWIDVIIVRHDSDDVISQISHYASFPVINAMSRTSHPCEILADLYSFKNKMPDFNQKQYLFVGPRGNIGISYYEASKILGYRFTQVCKKGYEIQGAKINYNLKDALVAADIILTDSLGEKVRDEYRKFIIDDNALKYAPSNVLVNPCPPFHRGYEISESVINSAAFVGYEFKTSLKAIQIAIIVKIVLREEI